MSAPLPGDDLVAVLAAGTHHDGLHHPLGADRVGQLLQRLGLDIAARLVLAPGELAQRQSLQALAGIGGLGDGCLLAPLDGDLGQVQAIAATGTGTDQGIQSTSQGAFTRHRHSLITAVTAGSTRPTAKAGESAPWPAPDAPGCPARSGRTWSPAGRGWVPRRPARCAGWWP